MSGPLVIKIGGAGVDEPRRNPALWRAIAEAFEILQGKLILVHGGGRAVDAHLERLGFSTHRIAGLRVTPDEQIDEIVAVLAGRVNKGIVGAIAAACRDSAISPVGLCLTDGGVAGVRRMTAPGGQDLGRVGAVVRDRMDDNPDHLLNVLLARGFLPVLCSIGYDHEGRPLNVNADDAAAEIAYLMAARRLVLLTDVAGILDEQGKVLAEVTPAEVTRLMERGVINGGMVPKAKAAARAAVSAQAPATIASWNNPSDLVRIARGAPAGTTVRPG